MAIISKAGDGFTPATLARPDRLVVAVLAALQTAGALRPDLVTLLLLQARVRRGNPGLGVTFTFSLLLRVSCQRQFVMIGTRGTHQ